MGQSEPMRIPKRWRYVGVYGPEVMLCAGIVRVGGVPQCFWAVWDRERRVLHERTRRRLGTVALPEGAVPSDSDGYHARETAWDWCAGAGRAADGRAVAWNLVVGVHDAPSGSERRVWIDGAPREVPPVAFTPRARRGRRPALRGRGAARPPRPRALRPRRERVPPALRDVLGHAARRRRARRGLRRDGAPPRALVTAPAYARNDPRTPSAGPAIAPDSSSARMSSSR